MSQWLTAALLATLAVVLCAAPPRDNAPTVLSVATLNLAHGRGLAVSQFTLPPEKFQANIDAIADLVRDKHPDVLALQEADGPCAWSGGFDHIRRLVERSKYPHAHHGLHFRVELGPAALRYGTALLARVPLRDTNSHAFNPPPFHTKGFVSARVEFDGRTLVVVSVHLDSQSPVTRRRQVDTMVGVLADSDAPLVVMGDLNSRWSNENDAARLLASKLGLSAYQPDQQKLNTFRANLPVRRIDWILISPQLEFVSYTIWPEQVSDHLGVAAKLRWRG